MVADADFVFRDVQRGDEPAIRRLVTSVLAEFGFDTDPEGLDSDLVDIIASYVDRGGVFRVLTTTAGEVVGCGGLYPLPNNEAELRKMYFFPVARGRGLGRALVADLVAFGRRAGYRRIVLETAAKLTTAGHIYRSFGFVETTSDHLARRADQALELDLSSKVTS
jgi:GNAT superfamily N-acetyltransferase